MPISILLPPDATGAPPPPVGTPAVWLELYGLVVRPKISETVLIVSRPVGTVVFTGSKHLHLEAGVLLTTRSAWDVRNFEGSQ